MSAAMTSDSQLGRRNKLPTKFRQDVPREPVARGDATTGTRGRAAREPSPPNLSRANQR